MNLRGLLLAVCWAVMGSFPAAGVTPRPAEFIAAQSWCGQVFPSTPRGTNAPFLRMLYQDVADNVGRGRSWRGTPYQLGEKVFNHGLSFNSTKHILVHLGAPGAHFTAQVGLENNDDTRRGETSGNGSVTFHVLVRDKEVFNTPVLRLKDGAKPLNVPLDGAEEFEIRVKDGGDGRGWDQALWAEAVIELHDGSKLRLQDIPFAGAGEENPFGLSFRYGGRNSTSLLKDWRCDASEISKSPSHKQRKLTWTDPASGLETRIEITQFTDFSAIEWVGYFSNHGSTNTPLLEDIEILDGVLPLATSGGATMHWAKGGVASFDDFAPQTLALSSGVKTRLQPGGGRSSSQVMPFFNFEGANAGIVAAVGWSGEWAVEVSADSANQVHMKAGLERTHLVLYPGETIRTPRMLLLFYEGDSWRGQNLLRQFLLTHHRVLRGSQPWMAPITCGNWGGTRAEVHLDNIQKIIQHQLPIDYYWIDAEWFGQGGWPVNVGNWQVKSGLYPAGFKPLSDALRGSGRELMLWFEPERVFKNTPWHKEHPDWLLGKQGENFLYNLGNPEARRFLTDYISDRITEFGLGCYRQDFNMDPLPFWREADAPDRQGISEIKHIEGLYAFWDELLARHPGLIIDNCASGGRRLDLETIGRATPFWRTDGPRDAIAHQCHTHGLLAWVPLSATSQDRPKDDYEFRSSMCSSLCLNWWVNGDVSAERIPDSFPFDWAKKTLDQYLTYRDCYYGDYYPLTSYSQSSDVWMSYQLDRQDMGKGLVVTLRRPDSPYESAQLLLKELEPKATYKITNLDDGKFSEATGKELMERGLKISLLTRPGSALYRYERR